MAYGRHINPEEKDWWLVYTNYTGDEKQIGNVYRYPNYEGGMLRPYYFTAFLSTSREPLKSFGNDTKFYSVGEAIDAVERAYDEAVAAQTSQEKSQ